MSTAAATHLAPDYVPKAKHCRCGIAFGRGRAEGIQPDRERSLELRTCECGQTNAQLLHWRPSIRADQVSDLICLVAIRDDLSAHEKTRRIAMMLEELEQAHREEFSR